MRFLIGESYYARYWRPLLVIKYKGTKSVKLNMPKKITQIHKCLECPSLTFKSNAALVRHTRERHKTLA